MRKIVLALFVIGLIPLVVKAQSAYYIKDTVAVVGVKIIDHGDLDNCKICTIDAGRDGISNLTPDKVLEYGFGDGRKYFARDIEIDGSKKKVFLERLIVGKSTLFYYRGVQKKLYFLEKEDRVLHLISKIDGNDKKFFRTTLKDLLSDCYYSSNSAKFVRYNKQSMTRLIKNYNSYIHTPFPHFKWGFTVGYEMEKLIIPTNLFNEYLEHINFTNNGAFKAGLFIDNPIACTDFSLNSNIYYIKHSYSLTNITNTEVVDFLATTSSIRLAVMVRYTLPFSKIRPYLNTGPMASSYFKNEMFGYATKINNNLYEISEFQISSKIDDKQLGFCVGGGIELPVTYRNSLFVDINYYNFYGSKMANSISLSGLHISTSYNF